MKLRTRLFLWVGSLFVTFFALSYLLEMLIAGRSLRQTEENLYQNIRAVYKEQRKDLEDFLGTALADVQAGLDVLLFRIGQYPFHRKEFAPTENDPATWERASELLLVNKEINFLDNQVGGEIASLIVANAQALHESKQVVIDPDFSWVLTKQEPAYIGIRFSLGELDIDPGLFRLDAEKEHDFYLFFDPEHFRQFSLHEKIYKLPPSIPAKLEKAKRYLETIAPLLKGKSAQEQRKWVLSLDKNKGPISSILPKKEIAAAPIVQEVLNRSFEQHWAEDQVSLLLWSLISFLQAGLFPEDPTSKEAPLGIALFYPEGEQGSLIFSKEVFYDTPVSIEKEGDIALISDPEKGFLFFGNQLSTSKNATLTLGVNIDHLLQRLALVSDQVALLVHKNEIHAVYGEEGNRMEKGSLFESVSLEKMNEKEMGIVDVKGEPYYYLRLSPYYKADLHFYILQPKKKAFQLIDSMREQMNKLLSNVSWNMRLIALAAVGIILILLHYVAKGITRPISELAKSTKAVAEGHFEQVKPLPNKPKGEIGVLYDSFQEMVQGLQDREKVRGVLNKVVSKEIAAEILKGNVQLGGEEREATILFADIRGFTAMTEKAQPAEVIDLLNSCMTKISQVVDQFGGVIDKYVGDEVMALFGIPVEKEKSPLSAVKAAVEMQKRVDLWNKERASQGKNPVFIGIGIHTGVVIAGNMGAENRLNYTVLGANVNLASRLCSRAEGGQVLLSEATANQVKPFAQLKSLQAQELKGFSQPIAVFAVEKIEEKQGD